MAAKGQVAPPALSAVLATPIMHWPLADARLLLDTIRTIGREGLIPSDYNPTALQAAITAGEGSDLDTVASTSFTWLTEDLRDGRTPMKARVQWFAFDKDMDVYPTMQVMARALASHDIAGTLAGLDPTYPDYAALKQALVTTPVADRKTRALIRANMDRWRWFSRDLGEFYLMTNVPEFQLRLVRRDTIVRTYRTIVGKPGKTATPQLSELVQGVIFNPTWTVPQSIVKGEGLGAKLIADPAKAKAEGYAVTKSADGTITVVQQPGPNNSLGYLKLDMPNAHAIFLHDTPSRNLFNAPFRALSHGCVRTERATELGIALSIIGGGRTADEAAAISASRKYTKVPMDKRQMPVYIGYFTMAKSIDGQMKPFADIYGRDAPVLASFAAPREVKTGQRTSSEKVEAIAEPGV
ncbi:MAG: hypothetical protein RLZZ136_624 [Pseudomonadota bacterium]